MVQERPKTAGRAGRRGHSAADVPLAQPRHLLGKCLCFLGLSGLLHTLVQLLMRLRGGNGPTATKVGERAGSSTLPAPSLPRLLLKLLSGFVLPALIRQHLFWSCYIIKENLGSQ